MKQASHLQEYTAFVRLLLVSWNTCCGRGNWSVNSNNSVRLVEGHVRLTFAINLPNEIVKNLDEWKETNRSDVSRHFSLPLWHSFDLWQLFRETNNSISSPMSDPFRAISLFRSLNHVYYRQEQWQAVPRSNGIDLSRKAWQVLSYISVGIFDADNAIVISIKIVKCRLRSDWIDKDKSMSIFHIQISHRREFILTDEQSREE